MGQENTDLTTTDTKTGENNPAINPGAQGREESEAIANSQAAGQPAWSAGGGHEGEAPGNNPDASDQTQNQQQGNSEQFRSKDRDTETLENPDPAGSGNTRTPKQTGREG
ncbi:hypothetical protein BH10ACI3_BH10ACI3_15870 [soil metagenome]